VDAREAAWRREHRDARHPAGLHHISLSDAGWKVFLAAFPKAAAQD
jgi:hypothetical protein